MFKAPAHLTLTRYVVLSLLLAVSGCAMITPKPSTAPSSASSQANQQHLASLARIQSFSLKGRLGVVTNPRGFSGGLEWQHQTADDNIDIFSPVGGKVANIVKNPNGVTLTTQDGNSLKTRDAESLTEATLGWRLPLKGLSDWALGKPTAGNIDAITWDDSGHLSTLKQDGWDISYENYTEQRGVFLPNKVLLKSERVNLKLLIDEWLKVEN